MPICKFANACSITLRCYGSELGIGCKCFNQGGLSLLDVLAVVNMLVRKSGLTLRWEV